MTEKFITKEGVLTDSVTKVYLADDCLYLHKDSSVIYIYEKLNIMDVDKIFPKEINISGFEFCYPRIDCSDFSVTYTAKENNDYYVSFDFDASLTSENFKLLKPKFEFFNRDNELFEEIDESVLQYHL